MLKEIIIDPAKGKERWVAHLDLLGASRLIESKHWEQVFSVYAESLEQFRRDSFDEHLIDRFSFSDSFIIYTVDQSDLSYRALDHFVRQFITSLIQREIPIRGAMSCGYFYADSENDLFFGQALLEAYRIGESQDWLGFVLCESAVAQLYHVGLPANERLNYASWQVPFKSKEPPCEIVRHSLPCFIIGGRAPGSLQKICRAALLRMQAAAKTDKVRRKYANTLEFLDQNVRNCLTISFSGQQKA